MPDATAPAERTWAAPAPRIDWADAAAEGHLGPAYTTRSAHDTLNRAKWSDYPQAANGERYRLRPGYNRAGALQRVDLVGPLEGSDKAETQPFVRRIAYNAKGQRTLIVYGNGLMTRYAHDPDTFRLARMRTERYKADPAAPLVYEPQGDPLQDIAHYYDTGGNILGIQEITRAAASPAIPRR